jgi:hypothetical protein
MVSMSLINDMAHTASNSVLKQQHLCATVIGGGKRLTKLTCNENRNRKWGNHTPSVHAEEGALLDYYGKNVFWESRSGWCLKERKFKAKVKKS